MNLPDWERRLLESHGQLAAAVLDRIRPLAQSLPDPDTRLAELGAFLLVDPGAGASLRAIAAEPELAGMIMRLALCSRHAFDFACRLPAVFWQIVEEGQHAQVWGRRLLVSSLSEELGRCRDDDARCQAFARFKHRHWLRVILGDICGTMRFEAVVSELSDITDALAQAACAQACARASARGVVPPFCALAFGKLGGRELNYSSDIDLVFIYEPGDGDKDEAHRQARRIGEHLIRALEGGEGERLFRVDMRLRPEGDRGELALSLRETVDYYWSVGRPWERQALIKARPMAGDLALGDRLLGELASWIYPADPKWEDLEESRTMRRRIEERAQELNIKTGAGGIRDIEFMAQHFQLLHGGREPRLRGRASLPTLRTLADLGILPRAAVHELEGHYVFLRTVEHRLQVWEDRQEHDLPTDPEQRRLLAARCGLVLPAFDARLAVVRARVRELAARHFLEGTPDDDAALALLIQGEADERLAGRVLAAAGFSDLKRAAADLRSLAAEPFFILSRARTERAVQRLLPSLLHLIGTSPEPDRTLANFVRVVGSVGGRAIFFELLAQHPQVLQLFVDLAGWSNLLVDLFEGQPGLPDEMADVLSRRPVRGIALHAEARQLIRGLADPAPPLAFLRARELAAVAARDLLGLSDGSPGARLSLLSEVLVTALLNRLVSDRAKSWGIPEEGGVAKRFCILAFGKMGGRELSYGSDLDVLFLCDSGGTCPRNGRDGEEFWNRIAQDLSRILQDGRLAEIDARLRPWGEQGPLVTTLPALAEYWSQPREMWERMAMVRAAFLAGDPRLADDALAILRERSLAAPRPADWAAQVRSMRHRLEESVASEDHIKRGRGGYVDAEFIAQALVLGHPLVELPEPPTTATCINRLGERGILPAEGVRALAEGLDFLRRVENRLRLADGRAVSALPASPEERGRLARRCGFADLAVFDASLAEARSALRHWFDTLIV